MNVMERRLAEAKTRLKQRVVMLWRALDERAPEMVQALDDLTVSSEWLNRLRAIEDAIDAGNGRGTMQRIAELEEWATAQLRALWPKKKGEQS